MGAHNALGELAKLIPDEADRLRGKREMRVLVSTLIVGDRVLVRPGAAIPVDGEIEDGESEVNEALITGESTAVSKKKGDPVIAGGLNGAGSITVRVTKVGADTAIAGIMKLVADAHASKSGAQLLAERSAAILFYIALTSASLTLLVWALISPDNPAFVIERVVTVLIIACPHALGLAIPLVAQISVTVGAKNGLLVRNRAVLEDARLVQVVVFDKTGTLTEGLQGVVDIVTVEGITVDEMLGLAASVEKKSEHPIATAIVAEAARRKIATIRSAKFQANAGKGAEASLAGRHVWVASLRSVTERGLTIGAELVHANMRAGDAGHTVVFVVDDSGVLGLITVADAVRPESAEAVAVLRKRGVRVAMLTGDSQAAGNWVATQLGITEVFAEVLPAQKAQIISQLQAGGVSVAMVGDGVNDAPALAIADVGIALGAGTDVAIDSAGLVLASSDPRGVISALALSQATYSVMRQNLFWATGYNVVAIPLAAGVLFAAGIVLSPAVGAALMSISTVVVVLNAQRLRRLTL
jgi:Cu2+-exporting ATPase